MTEELPLITEPLQSKTSDAEEIAQMWTFLSDKKTDPNNIASQTTEIVRTMRTKGIAIRKNPDFSEIRCALHKALELEDVIPEA